MVEPGARSVQTYGNVKRLAADLGVKRVRVVANKVRDERDEAYVRSVIPQRTSSAASTTIRRSGR